MLYFDIYYDSMNAMCYNFHVYVWQEDEILSYSIYHVGDDDVFLTVCYLVSILTDEYSQYTNDKEYNVFLPKKWLTGIPDELLDSYTAMIDNVSSVNYLKDTFLKTTNKRYK